MEEEVRSIKVSVMITPSLAARLDGYRHRDQRTRSTAAAMLIERALDATEPKGEP